MSFITVQYELFVVIVSCIMMQYELALSGSVAMQELVQEVSLVTVSCDVICSGNVSCAGTILEDEYGSRLIIYVLDPMVYGGSNEPVVDCMSLQMGRWK